MLTMLLLLGMGLFQSAREQGYPAVTDNRIPVLFVAYAGSEAQVRNITRLVRSLREFGGAYKDAPFWIYLDPELGESSMEKLKQFEIINVKLRVVSVPEAASWYFLILLLLAGTHRNKLQWATRR